MAAGTYYLVGNSISKIFTTADDGTFVANALKMEDTDAQKIELVRNDDNTVSIKSVKNNKYLSMGEDLILRATADSIGMNEKFYLLKASQTTVGLMSVANEKVACADEDVAQTDAFKDAGIPIIVNRDSVGGWESFKLYNMKQQLIGETIKYDYSGWHYFEAEDADKVINVGGGTTEDNRDNYSKGWAVSGMGTNTTAENVAADWSNLHYVKFDVSAENEGTYQMVLRYNGNNDR